MLSDALMAQGALSVSVEDAQAGTAEETPQFGEPGCPTTPLWQHSRVIALFDGATPLATLTAQLAAACQACGIELPDALAIEEVAEENWVQLTQAQFDPIRINDRLWIVPSWHDAPDPAAVNLVLDPGMAFGTGSHPTTRLCLEWLCDELQTGQRVLDYGCGSGILAIAAARLGAGAVLGVDIDDNALTAARDNAAINQVALALRHSREPLEETFDCVLANILTNPLCVLAPLLTARLAPGGRLVLSGVLESQTGQVIAAYAPFIDLRAGAVLDGWVRLEGARDQATGEVGS
ncbi:MAG: 50S ribosomal protein L11 methyltransferase [Sterolibacterium sp.]|nr:50S ribosomal protein L11 methyltransferase [Sterolibacterium sp.]